MKAADGRAVVHGVEGGDFVDSNGGHFEYAGNLVHDGYGGKTVLALAEVEEGHDGGFLVLGRVAFQDLGNEFFVGGVEFERDGRIVVWGIAVLIKILGPGRGQGGK